MEINDRDFFFLHNDKNAVEKRNASLKFCDLPSSIYR